MSLVKLWKKSAQDIEAMQVRQIVAMAGSGELTDDSYWHIRINEQEGKFVLLRKKGLGPLDLSRFLLKGA